MTVVGDEVGTTVVPADAFLEDLDLDGSLTDFDDMRRDGIRLPIPELLLLPLLSIDVLHDAEEDPSHASSPADLLTFCA